MAAQFDLIPGFDISSLSSVTQTQEMAIVGGAAPYPNIGFILYGATSPDVANNARFARYLWIDTSGGLGAIALKYYDGAVWAAVPLGAVSSLSQISNNLITIGKLSVAGGGALKLVRVNAANTAFEYINFSDLLTAGAITFSSLETTGHGANYFLKRNSADTAYALEAFSAAFIAVNSIGYSQLLNSAGAGRVLISNGGSNAFTDSELNVPLIKPTGGTALQVARVNAAATAMELATPPIIQVVHTNVTAASSQTTVIPFDNTVPTSAEGDAVAAFDTAITPIRSDSFLLIELLLQVGASGAFDATVALFKDADAAAIAAASVTCGGADTVATLMLRFRVASASTTARTYKIRVGPNTAGTIYINRVSATPLFGGICQSSMRITEVPV